jgi:DNA-binding transcriptional ArsR family regulator
MRGDADLAALGTVLADGSRARMLLALGDGRALPASVLAAEAGVAASTASGHLSRLVDAGLLSVRVEGRHRYYRLAGPHVGELLEALARVAPAAPVRSLREGTRAHALRAARTCYDHIAGRLGVELFRALLDAGAITGGDGLHVVGGSGTDRLSAPGRDVDYRLTTAGARRLSAIGVDAPRPGTGLRYCVDWTEQAHHLAGPLGRALAARLVELRWLRRAERSRALHITPAGRHGLAAEFGLQLGAPSSAIRSRSASRHVAASGG